MANAKKKQTTKAKPTVGEQVAEAAVLNRVVKASAARIGELKVDIRQYALMVASARPPEERTEKVEIESEEGTATVSFPKDHVSLVEGANPRALKSVLSEETWKFLFEEKVVLADGFDDKYKALSTVDQSHVRALVQWKTPDPSVILPK